MDENLLEGVTLEITKKCNLRCVFCFASSNHTFEEPLITYNDIDNVINQIITCAPKKVTITGGEPLTAPEYLFYVSQKLKQHNIAMNLNTNLTLITDEYAKVIKRDFSDTFVFSSILSPEATTCDIITKVAGSYKSAMEGIKICKNNGIRVSINITISKQNICDLQYVNKLVKETGIDRLCISRVIPPVYDRDNKNNVLSKDDIMHIANTLIDIHDSFGIIVSSNTPLPRCIIGLDEKYDIIQSTMCNTGLARCAINLHTGDVIACSQERKIYGNVYIENLSECFIKMHNNYLEGNLKEKCTNCTSLSKCGGECRWSGCYEC